MTDNIKALMEGALARESKAHSELIRILSVGEHVRMSIPANVDRDTDLVIQAALNDIAKLATALASESARADGLAEKVAAAWDEGRESLAHDMLSPVLDTGMRSFSVNPHRILSDEGTPNE